MTPIQNKKDLALKMGLNSLFLKREDLHQFGSHKGRSIPFMIENGIKSGHSKFVLSSSGNSALAAILYIKERQQDIPREFDLRILVGKNINPEKFGELKKMASSINQNNEPQKITIIQTDEPLKELFKLEKDGYCSLRQSTNEDALIGYRALAEEILQQLDSNTEKDIPDENSYIGAVFMATSSGTLAQGIFEGFKQRSNNDPKIKIPQIHIVQTESCHPISGFFDIGLNESKNERSIADAIVDKTALRKEKVIDAIKKSDGFGWIVTDGEILNAQKILKDNGLIVTPNGALAFAGLLKSIKLNRKISGQIVCIISGR